MNENKRDPNFNSIQFSSYTVNETGGGIGSKYEENSAMLEKIKLRYGPILSEIFKKASNFDLHLKENTKLLQVTDAISPRTKNKLMEGAALTRGKIDEMKRNKIYKINKGAQSKESWVFNMNIGNVMHLIPLNLDDFVLSFQISHELSKDALYEKAILLAIAYFSFSTECRFVFSEENKEHYQLESRYWHKAAVEIGCLFLPSDCPLISHIVTSYEKHHSLAQEIIVLFKFHIKKID